jgi:hypothetical protein
MKKESDIGKCWIRAGTGTVSIQDMAQVSCRFFAVHHFIEPPETTVIVKIII